jgi:arginine decarboxylase
MNPLPPVLLIGADGDGRLLGHTAMQQIADGLQALGYRTMRAPSPGDGLVLVESHPVFAAVVLDWDLGGGKHCPRDTAAAIIHGIRTRSRTLPIFLAVETTSPGTLPLSVAREVRGYLHPLSETPETTAHRLDFAVRQYFTGLLPPYLRALKQHMDDGLYQWDDAGHHGGETYQRHPVGAEFQRLFGEGLTRADAGIPVLELGNWLEHTGPAADSERRAARVFGADWTYFVLGGSSAANRIVLTGVVADGDIALSDRSCHRSVIHGFTLSGARPVYLRPSCNGYGMLGPIPPWSLAPGHIRELIEHSPLAREGASPDPAIAVITNSTYDGLCCDVERVLAAIGPAVPRAHFDEASFGYAHVHPIYDGRHAMGVASDAPDRPTLFAVQSTHRMLPALSMSSMLHVKPGRRAPVDPQVFNQSFMMHGTTSPFHPIIASNDVATAMMEPPAGRTLLDEAIRDAIGFRQAMAATRTRFLEGGGSDAWFFSAFQPEQVTHPVSGASFAFGDAPVDLLATHPGCWTLKPGEAWHGFADDEVAGDYALVDPMKVTIACPGIDASGRLAASGIPACVLMRFLDERRIYIARSGAYTVLVPFSVGSGRGRWGALLEALHEFKRFYDGDVTVGEALPKLVATHARYANLRLRSLCDTVHAAMTSLEIPSLSRAAAAADPQPVLTPAAAYQELVRRRTELVRTRDAAGRIAGVMVIPYPLGVPIALPGERIGPAASPGIRYLEAIEAFDRTFPGFEHHLYGVEYDDERSFLLRVIVEERTRRATLVAHPGAHGAERCLQPHARTTGARPIIALPPGRRG